MKHWKYWAAALLTGVLVIAAFGSFRLAKAQGESGADMVAKINQARLENGLAPLAASPSLEKAAQRHSDDMAKGSFVDDTGSDGSTSRDRMLQSGYTGWSGNRVIWGVNLNAEAASFDQVFDSVFASDAQRRVMLNPRYREIGIGSAVAANGKRFWVLLYGAQPGVLPIFLNDGAPVSNNATVSVRLTQEDAVPNGDGATMGKAIEVRLSRESNFSGAGWQPWQPLLEYAFDSKPGLKTLYVQYRDASSRVANMTASIQYDPNVSTKIRPVAPGQPVASSGTSQPAEATAVETPIPTQVSAVITVPPPTPTAEPTQTGQAAEPPTLAPLLTIGDTPNPPPATPEQEIGAPTAQAQAPAAAAPADAPPKSWLDYAGAAMPLGVALLGIAQIGVIAWAVRAFFKFRGS